MAGSVTMIAKDDRESTISSTQFTVKGIHMVGVGTFLDVLHPGSYISRGQVCLLSF